MGFRSLPFFNAGAVAHADTFADRTLTKQHYGLCYVSGEKYRILGTMRFVQPSISTWLGVLSLAGYVLAGTRLEHAGGDRGVLLFLSVFGALFAIYALAARWTWDDGDKDDTIRILPLGCPLSPALLPAGLPPESLVDDLGADSAPSASPTAAS